MVFCGDADYVAFCAGASVRILLCSCCVRLTDGCRIPNLPFFYLVYRAWSHWRAIAGGKHIQWLVGEKLLKPTPSRTLDKLYGEMRAVEDGKERLLLTQEQVTSFSETLDVPALEIELERAIWQVEQALREDGQDVKEKSDGVKSKDADKTKDVDEKSKETQEKQ